MSKMFSFCHSLTSLDVCNFKTDNVTIMCGMFSGCNSLTSLDVSNFKTDNVTDMTYMFDDCYELKTIYVGEGWNTNAVQSADNLFKDCWNLVGGKGTKYIYQGEGIEFAHIDGGENNPGYFTAGPMLLSITNLPSKYEYIEGEQFSADGGILTVIYKNFDTETIELSKTKITGFNNTKLGEQKLTASYLGLETTFNVKVVAKSPVSVDIKALPTEIEYATGQDFTIDGGVLTVTFNNGTTEDIALTSDNVDVNTSKILIYNSIGTVTLLINNVEESNRITLKPGVYTGVLITRNGRKTFRVAVKYNPKQHTP